MQKEPDLKLREKLAFILAEEFRLLCLSPEHLDHELFMEEKKLEQRIWNYAQELEEWFEYIRHEGVGDDKE